MRHLFRHKEHLLRMAMLFVGGTLLFLVIRGFMVPADFGEYGHFRPGALDDARAQRVQYAGQFVCLQCHTDVGEARQGGKHERVKCEACHGAQADHAEGRADEMPVRPDTRDTCLRCHGRMISRPEGFPQVVPAEHSPEGACTDCHVAHAPGLS